MVEEKNKLENNSEPKESYVCEEKSGKLVCEKKEEELVVKKSSPLSGKGNIFIGTLNIMAAPAKAIAEPLKSHYTKKYEGKYKHARKLFILDMILLAIVGFLVFADIYLFFGGRFGFFTPNNRALIDVSWGNEKIISGDEAALKIDYLNNSKDLLKDVYLTVDFPEYFKVTNYSESFDPRSHIFNVGDLPPGANGSFQIAGRLYGGTDKPDKVEGVLTYSVGARQGSQAFQAEYLVEGSKVGAELSAPEAAIKNQFFNFNVSYYNNTPDKAEQILIVPEGGANFRLGKANSFYDENLGGWVIKGLEPGGVGEMAAEGAFFTDKISETLRLKTYLFFGNQKLLQAGGKTDIKIIDSGLVFGIEGMGISEAVNLGEKIDYRINFLNKGKYNFRNVIITAVLESEFFDLSSAEGGLVKDGAIIFDYNSYPELALLKPARAGELNFSVKLRNDVPAGEIFKGEALIKNYLMAEYILEDDIDRPAKEKSPIFEKKVNTDLRLDSFARYFSASGDQLGRGPVPPKVGATTKYWIFLYPLNNLSDATDVVISAVLPSNVELTGRSLPMDLIEFNTATRELRWNVGKVNRYSGESGKGVSFEVSLIPEESQAGKVAELLKDIKISGQDSFTGQELFSVFPDITTELSRDLRAKGEGVVKK
ncbi:MAG: hypothetical protein PHD51_00035 [Patescibacteria group bacterium]|nr:hypothetical protein [Patescibacteria group bacterium]MDD5490743.1 hypothetical protein [Patescibacteria group bacterium]